MLTHSAFPPATHVFAADVHTAPVFLSKSLLLGGTMQSHCGLHLDSLKQLMASSTHIWNPHIQFSD